MSLEEEAYWASFDFMFELLKNVPVHFFWKNKAGIYRGCNQVFATSLGLNTVDDVIGKNDYELPVASEHSDAYRMDDMRIMNSKHPQLNFEEEQALVNGQTITLLTNKVPLLDKNNDTMGILGVYSDITSIKQQQAELMIAMEKAEAASIAKSEFLANMSHDIRTPLAGIISLSEVMSFQAKDNEFKMNLESICEAGLQLMNFFNDCLALTRMDHLSNKDPSQRFDLKPLLDNIHKLFLPSLSSKGLKFTLSCGPKCAGLFIGSKEPITRMLQNLVANAIKFTDKGSIDVAVSVVQGPEPGQAVVTFTVSDTGIGIPEGKLDDIFEKFTRLNPSYQGTYSGSGMGLYLVKQYVESLAGSIDVESKLGVGSVFTVTVPMLVDTATPIKVTE